MTHAYNYFCSKQVGKFEPNSHQTKHSSSVHLQAHMIWLVVNQTIADQEVNWYPSQELFTSGENSIQGWRYIFSVCE